MTFQQKYAGNAEMQEVIRRADAALEGSRINDETLRNVIYETVYGYQNTIAKDFNLPMDLAYERLSKLNDIEFTEVPNAAGVFWGQYDGNPLEKPSQIQVKTFYEGDYAGIMSVVSHELCHNFSYQYSLDPATGKYTNENELSAYRMTDEDMTEYSSARIQQFLGYKLQTKYFNAEDVNGMKGTMYSHSYGYYSTCAYGGMIAATYGEEMFKAKYANGPVYTLGILNVDGVDNALEAIDKQGPKIDLAQHANVTGEFVSSAFLRCHDNFATYLNITSEMVDYSSSISIDGNSRTPLVFTVANSRELAEFASQYMPDKKERSPKEDTNFLITINGLRMMHVDFTEENLRNMSWKEIHRDENNSVDLEVQYGGSIYCFSGGRDINTGLLYMSDAVELMESHAAKMSLQDRVEVLNSKYQEPTAYDFNKLSLRDFSALASYSNYNSLYTIPPPRSEEILTLFNLCDRRQEFVFYEDHKMIDTFRDFVDAEGNNIMYLAAVNPDRKDIVLAAFSQLPQEEKDAMLQSPNNFGYSASRIMLDKMIHGDKTVNLTKLEHYGYQLSEDDINYMNSSTVYPNGNKVPNLILASRHASVEDIYFLIDSGIDPNVKTPIGETIISNLASRSDADLDLPDVMPLYEFLHQRGVNPDIENNIGMTPLMSAISEENIRQVTALVKSMKSDVDYVNQYGQSPISILVQQMSEYPDYAKSSELQNLTGIMQTLHKEGANFNAVLQDREGRQYTALNELIDEYASPIFVRQMLKNGADISAHAEGEKSVYDRLLDGDTRALMKLAQAGVSYESLKIPEGTFSDEMIRRTEECDVDFDLEKIVSAQIASIEKDETKDVGFELGD